MRKYFGKWSTRDDVFTEEYGFFPAWASPEIPPNLPTDDEIIFASYAHECHEGDALVIFTSGGLLWEVNASHCSCNGLSGQWSPEITTWQALVMRQNVSRNYGHTEEAVARFVELVAQHTLVAND